MVSVGDILMIHLKDWPKTFSVTKTLSNILCDGWTTLAQLFLISMAKINPEICFILKILEFNWIIQNYSSFIIM